jgi:nucleotide-binding universal stress UspA family protein
MQRIMVAVDGSEHADRAVDMAADLALRYRVPLSVLHVRTRLGTGQIPVGLAGYERLEHMYLTEEGLLEGAATRIAENAAGKARRAGVQTVETIVETGDPASTIVHAAEASGSDLIVLGSRGLGELGGLLLGSVSHKVGHLAHCPVLTVR